MSKIIATSTSGGVEVDHKIMINSPSEIPTQEKNLILGNSVPSNVLPDEGYNLSKVNVSLDDTIIKAENIKKNISILGITGNYEGVTYQTYDGTVE